MIIVRPGDKARRINPRGDKVMASYMKCWEFKKCGMDIRGDCPALKTTVKCWFVTGTKCSGKMQGDFLDKAGNCRACEYYAYVHAITKSLEAAHPGAR